MNKWGFILQQEFWGQAKCPYNLSNLHPPSCSVSAVQLYSSAESLIQENGSRRPFSILLNLTLSIEPLFNALCIILLAQHFTGWPTSPSFNRKIKSLSDLLESWSHKKHIISRALIFLMYLSLSMQFPHVCSCMYLKYFRLSSNYCGNLQRK